MKYHEFTTNRNKQPKRVGRGIAAGQGKTAGRGTKGQGARTGSKRRPGFEGGQNPLMQRMPKLHGFRSQAETTEVVYTGQLEKIGGKINTEVLAKAGLISNPFVRVKLIVQGELTKKVNVSLLAASETAIAMIEKAGGTFEKVDILARPVTKKEK